MYVQIILYLYNYTNNIVILNHHPRKFQFFVTHRNGTLFRNKTTLLLTWKKSLVC